MTPARIAQGLKGNQDEIRFGDGPAAPPIDLSAMSGSARAMLSEAVERLLPVDEDVTSGMLSDAGLVLVLHRYVVQFTVEDAMPIGSVKALTLSFDHGHIEVLPRGRRGHSPAGDVDRAPRADRGRDPDTRPRDPARARGAFLARCSSGVGRRPMTAAISRAHGTDQHPRNLNRLTT